MYFHFESYCIIFLTIITKLDNNYSYCATLCKMVPVGMMNLLVMECGLLVVA